MSFKTMDDGQVLLYAVSGKPILIFPITFNECSSVMWCYTVIVWFTFDVNGIYYLQSRLLLNVEHLNFHVKYGICYLCVVRDFFMPQSCNINLLSIVIHLNSHINVKYYFSRVFFISWILFGYCTTFTSIKAEIIITENIFCFYSNLFIFLLIRRRVWTLDFASLFFVNSSFSFSLALLTIKDFFLNLATHLELARPPKVKYFILIVVLDRIDSLIEMTGCFLLIFVLCIDLV